MVSLNRPSWEELDIKALVEHVQCLNDPEMRELIRQQSEQGAHEEMEETFGPIGECLYCKNKTFLPYYGIACEECTSYLPG